MRPADLALAMRTIAALKSGQARTERKALGLRQSDVAAVIRPPVTRQAVSQWEAGIRRPSAVHALAYARVLTRIAEDPEAFI